MKRIAVVLVLALGFLMVLGGCSNLFAPQGCTSQIVITDSLKVVGDTAWRVDTLQRFKLCVQ